MKNDPTRLAMDGPTVGAAKSRKAPVNVKK